MAVITALLTPALLGSFGVGIETAHWYQVQKSLQNAADSAALAAATNASSSYSTEAQATTAQYGFNNGSNNVTVSASNTAACPAGGSTCYSVTITEKVPLYLTQMLGFHGNTTISSAYAQSLSATAVAAPGTSPRTYCLLALASSGATGILSNGAPFANLDGCDVMSNTNATCNGHNLDAQYGDAHDTSTGCGVIQDSNVPAVSDPYAALASNIPANPCGTTPNGVSSSYPQEPAKKKDPALPNVSGSGATSNVTWGATPSGSVTWGAVQYMCGDVQLAGNLNVTTPAGGTVLVVENGQLDVPSGDTIQTQAGSGLTVIFTGTDSSSYTYAPTGGGTLDIAAPTSWHVVRCRALSGPCPQHDWRSPRREHLSRREQPHRGYHGIGLSSPLNRDVQRSGQQVQQRLFLLRHRGRQHHHQRYGQHPRRRPMPAGWVDPTDLQCPEPRNAGVLIDACRRPEPPAIKSG